MSSPVESHGIDNKANRYFPDLGKEQTFPLYNHSANDA